MQSRYARRFWGTSLLALCVLCLQAGVFSALTAGAPVTARAEGGEEAAPAEEKPAETSQTTEEGRSALGFLWHALGPLYTILFLFITFNLVALWVMNVLAVRRENVIPGILLQNFEAHLNEKRYQEAYELAKADDSFLGRVLAAGMQQLSSGYDAATSAMQEVGEEENMKMEQRLGYVALIAQIGPMVGLLGTVHGMVIAFARIAASTTSPKPADLAQGIMMALMTTVLGLCVAIPSIVYYQFVRNRLNRLVMEVGVVSGELMKRFSAVSTAPKKS